MTLEPKPETPVHVGIARKPSGARVVFVQIEGEVPDLYDAAGARPMHPDWARSLRDQCDVADVPFLFKQWGEWCPTTDPRTFGIPGHGLVKGNPERRDIGAGVPTWRVGKKAAGRLLYGRTHDAFPTPRTP